MVVAQEESLSSYARFLTKDSEDAKDLMQETIVRALVKRDKFTIGSNMRAWLHTIMRNIFINNYRKNKRIVFTTDGEENEQAALAARDVAWNSGWNKLREREVKKAVDDLPAAYRMPLELYYKGYLYKEISAILDEPLGTVKSRIHLAKKTLSQTLYN